MTTKLQWFVPEFDKALNCWQRIATIEFVWGGAGYKIQVVPMTMGDVPTANLIAATPLQHEALKAIAYDMQAWKDGENIALDKVRAAIRAGGGITDV